MISGIFIIILGWVLWSIVLYIVAVALLVLGVLLLYYKLKSKVRGYTPFQTLCEYIAPIFYLIVGTLLLFNQAAIGDIILVWCGVVAVVQGGLLLFNALAKK